MNRSCRTFSPAQVNWRKSRELGVDAQKRRQARRFTLKDFHYEEGLDQYICPDGKVLRLQVKRCVGHGTYIGKILLRKKIAGLARSI
jgi:hypothetical protein